MSASAKRLITIGVFFILCVLSAFLLFGANLIAIGVAALVGLVLGAIVGSFFHEEIRAVAGPRVEATLAPIREAAREVVSQVTTPNLDALREKLIEVELLAAEAGLQYTLRAKLKTITDRLEPVMTGLVDAYAGNELTWLACRIAETRLPEAVMQFIRLPEDSRAAKESEFLATLDVFLGHIEQCEKVLTGSAEVDMAAVAAGIQMQFAQGTL